MDEKQERLSQHGRTEEKILQCGDLGTICYSDELGRGGFGVVYKGKFKEVPVAVKIFDPQSLEKQASEIGIDYKGLLKIMEAGIRTQFKLSGLPNVLKVFWWNMEANPPYVVMELVERKDNFPMNLSEWIKQKRPTSQPIERIKIFKEILDSVAQIHNNGEVHGDLKPLNLLIDAGQYIKLTDFSSGVPVSRKDQYGPSYVAASKIKLKHPSTKPYSCEMRERQEYYDDSEYGRLTRVKCDIYALGVIFFQIYEGFTTERLLEDSKTTGGVSSIIRNYCSDNSVRDIIEACTISFAYNNVSSLRADVKKLLLKSRIAV